MRSILDWVVAYAVVSFAALLVLRAYVSVGVLAYAIPLAVLVISAGVRLMKGGHSIPRPVRFYVAGWAVFVGWLMMSSLWRIQGIDIKQEVILLGGMLAVAVAALLSLSSRAVKRITPAFWVVSLPVAVFIFVQYARIGSLRGYGEVLGGYYLVPARVLGLGAVSSGLSLLTSRRRSLFLWIAFPILLVALAMSLARGALISTLGILLLAAVFLSVRLPTSRRTIWTWIASRLKKLSLGFVIIATVGLTVFLAFQVERTAVRLRRMFFSFGQELESGGRGALWETALENIMEAPLTGFGLGSSGLMAGAHEAYYPHNLFLQAWLDGGLIAFLLLFALIAFPFLLCMWYLVKGEIRSTLWVPQLGLFSFLVLEYLKSTNFYTGRLLIVVGVVAVWAVCSFGRTST
ncbi:O-antigen ligase [Salinibacter ruber]|uniref:O-antigen ligase family protein n=1 Tax=Salinibacter ruber TaxID=146919 RepID=UPI002169CD80|nr:O-antigen ligase family protein [Salinibacter ruber]MCS3938737.1 O-antigen ligase [Salinibacter ruber]